MHAQHYNTHCTTLAASVNLSKKKKNIKILLGSQYPNIKL
jgi:hypothetical protein